MRAAAADWKCAEPTDGNEDPCDVDDHKPDHLALPETAHRQSKFEEAVPATGRVASRARFGTAATDLGLPNRKRENIMATKGSKTTLVAAIGFIILVAILLWLVISGSGLLPGDTGVEPIADGNEGQSGSTLMNLGAWPWTMIVLVATIVLGVGIAYGQYRSRQVTRADLERTEAATRALHEQERDPTFKD
jgi:hypothetical protein